MSESVKNWSVNFMVILLVVLAGLYFQGRANTAEAALCGIKATEQRRIVASETYLEDVRTGRRDQVPGITEADIRTSIARSRDTIRALSKLHCAS